MKFWNYLGEFFLFRWLFGSYRHKEEKLNMYDRSIQSGKSHIADDIDYHFNSGRRYNSSHSRYDSHDYGSSQSYDEILDDQDEYDMMEDDF